MDAQQPILAGPGLPTLTHPPVELRALRVFMEVAAARSMSLASAKLGMTQSAVSQAVRKLEADLGVALVERGRRPVTLTTAGLMLERRAEPLLRDAAALPQALRDAGDVPAQQIRLGLVDTFASTAGPGLVQELTASATRVVIWSGLAPSLGAALLGRDVDAIVTPDTLDDLDGLMRFPLWKEPFLLLLPQAWRADAAGLSLEALAAALPMIRYSARSHTGLQVERHLRRVGVAAERRIEVDGSDALVAMVAAGVGWAISTPLCLLQGVGHAAGAHAAALPPPGFNRTLSLVCWRDGPASLAAHTAEAASRVLRRTCLPRLRTMLPRLAEGIHVTSYPTWNSPVTGSKDTP
jgi:DNA-binding transcriptional LysR family regulator